MTSITSIDPKQFRRALGAFTTGVTVVTTRGVDGTDIGLTANSFNSVSLEPPMVLWSLDKKSSSLQHFMTGDHFAVHILAADQEAISNRFARSGADRFAELEVGRGHGDMPLLDGCATRFQCRTTYRYEGGDHVIFVGEVLEFDGSDRQPLVFHDGKYGLLLKKPTDLEGSDPGFGDDWLGFLLGRAYFQMQIPLRADVEKRGLEDIHYAILSVLGTGEGRSTDEISRLVEITGHRPSEKHFQVLAAKGLVEIRTTDRGGVRFTKAGRQYAIQLLAAGKSGEADAVRGLDEQEARLLTILLKRVIRETEANLPDVWRKENFWREDNIRGARAAAPHPNLEGNRS